MAWTGAFWFFAIFDGMYFSILLCFPYPNGPQQDQPANNDQMASTHVATPTAQTQPTSDAV